MILYQDAAQRGRADGEVMALLREGLAGRRAHHAASTRSAASSSPSTRRWSACSPGDLCLILVDQVEEALAHLAQRIAEPVAA